MDLMVWLLNTEQILELFKLMLENMKQALKRSTMILPNSKNLEMTKKQSMKLKIVF